MKKNTSWKVTDELSVTFQSSVSGAGEFGLKKKILCAVLLPATLWQMLQVNFTSKGMIKEENQLHITEVV